MLGRINTNKTYLKELKNMSDKMVQRALGKAYKNAIDGIAKSIKNIEALIARVIAENESLRANHKLLVTVPGFGHLTAVYLICRTNNFAGKISGKQLACHAGVVPFGHTSGISVKSKNKVHKMANKDLKKMLHLCSPTDIQHYPEFKDYYERKKTEGKHGMNILNAIRNKIVLRAAAVVNNQKPYVDNYKIAA